MFQRKKNQKAEKEPDIFDFSKDRPDLDTLVEHSHQRRLGLLKNADVNKGYGYGVHEFPSNDTKFDELYAKPRHLLGDRIGDFETARHKAARGRQHGLGISDNYIEHSHQRKLGLLTNADVNQGYGYGVHEFPMNMSQHGDTTSYSDKYIWEGSNPPSLPFTSDLRIRNNDEKYKQTLEQKMKNALETDKLTFPEAYSQDQRIKDMFKKMMKNSREHTQWINERGETKRKDTNSGIGINTKYITENAYFSYNLCDSLRKKASLDELLEHSSIRCAGIRKREDINEGYGYGVHGHDIIEDAHNTYYTKDLSTRVVTVPHTKQDELKQLAETRLNEFIQLRELVQKKLLMKRKKYLLFVAAERGGMEESVLHQRRKTFIRK